MDISYVHEFIVLSDLCNYRKAADALFMSQTTLFNHIKALEKEFQVSLFDHQGKNIRLSEYGELFLPYARIMTEATSAFQSEVTDRKKRDSMKIMIGSQYYISDLIEKFNETHTGYVIYDIITYSTEEALYDNNYDLAFIRNLDHSDDRYDSVLYANDQLACAVPVSHPLSSHKTVSTQELKNENFIAYSYKSKHINHELLLQNIGIPTNIYANVSDITEAVRLAESGKGCIIVSENELRKKYNSDLRILDFDPPISYTVSLCWRKDKPLSEGAKEFINFVKASV